MLLLDKFKVGLERYWLPFGFFVLLAGMYLFPTRNSYKTGVYLSLFLPALVWVLMGGWKSMVPLFKKSGLALVAVLGYYALSSVWGGADESLKNFKHAGMFLLALMGVYLLYDRQRRVFDGVCCLAIIVVGAVSLLWVLDYYVLVDNSLDVRFMSRSSSEDYFNLYHSEKYATFYNPLLLSHTLVFFFSLATLQLFERGKNNAVRCFLILGLLSISLLLLFAQTRSAWISVSCVLAFNLVWRFRGKGLAALLGLGVLAAIGFVLEGDVALRRGLSLRPEIWMESLRAIVQQPVFGHGLGADLTLYIDVAGRSFYDTHNFWLESLYYGGLFGLALWAWFGISLLKEFLGGARTAWVLTWLIVFLLGGMADGDGMLSRPNEHWFNIVLPIIFMLICVKSHEGGREAK